MPKYTVEFERSETYVSTVAVEADSEEEAVQMVESGEWDDVLREDEREESDIEVRSVSVERDLRIRDADYDPTSQTLLLKDEDGVTAITVNVDHLKRHLVEEGTLDLFVSRLRDAAKKPQKAKARK